MGGLESLHADHGATFTERGGQRVVADYGTPGRVHQAVRRGVGVLERAVGVVTVSGSDRVEFVDNAVTNRIPAADGEGVYALLLDPQGRIELDLYVFSASDRLLLLTPPGEAADLASEWTEKTFIQDVEVRDATEEFTVFGVYGPEATEKIASVMSTGTPEAPLSFVRGAIGDEGVTIARDDGIVGEEGYFVITAVESSERVFDSLLTHGLNAVPMGRETWETLTLEAGTPLFESELAGRLPNDLGLRNAVDFEKGCFVGQEVVSRIENRGNPARQLIGLAPTEQPAGGAAVFAGDTTAGEITRATHSPDRDGPIAFALLEADATDGDLSVRIDETEVAARRVPLPFFEGSARSARRPRSE